MGDVWNDKLDDRGRQMELTKIKKLVGKDLKGFKIIEMTEVYQIDDNGLRSSSIGFFKDPNTAVAFVGVQTDASWHKTGQALVLTDGIIGYVITQLEPVKFFDDETEVMNVKKKVIAKLSPAERKLLGFED
jgi:hypothetical protein